MLCGVVVVVVVVVVVGGCFDVRIKGYVGWVGVLFVLLFLFFSP